jgi:hypothetical protein
LKADAGNHQILSVLIVLFRPIPAGRDWLLYGDEYGRMKFCNLPKPDSQLRLFPFHYESQSSELLSCLIVTLCTVWGEIIFVLKSL